MGGLTSGPTGPSTPTALTPRPDDSPTKQRAARFAGRLFCFQNARGVLPADRIPPNRPQSADSRSIGALLEQSSRASSVSHHAHEILIRVKTGAATRRKRSTGPSRGSFPGLDAYSIFMTPSPVRGTPHPPRPRRADERWRDAWGYPVKDFCLLCENFS